EREVGPAIRTCPDHPVETRPLPPTLLPAGRNDEAHRVAGENRMDTGCPIRWCRRLIPYDQPVLAHCLEAVAPRASSRRRRLGIGWCSTREVDDLLQYCLPRKQHVWNVSQRSGLV